MDVSGFVEKMKPDGSSKSSCKYSIKSFDILTNVYVAVTQVKNCTIPFRISMEN